MRIICRMRGEQLLSGVCVCVLVHFSFSLVLLARLLASRNFEKLPNCCVYSTWWCIPSTIQTLVVKPLICFTRQLLFFLSVNRLHIFYAQGLTAWAGSLSTSLDRHHGYATYAHQRDRTKHIVLRATRPYVLC